MSSKAPLQALLSFGGPLKPVQQPEERVLENNDTGASEGVPGFQYIPHKIQYAHAKLCLWLCFQTCTK